MEKSDLAVGAHRTVKSAGKLEARPGIARAEIAAGRMTR